MGGGGGRFKRIYGSLLYLKYMVTANQRIRRLHFFACKFIYRQINKMNRYFKRHKDEEKLQKPSYKNDNESST